MADNGSQWWERLFDIVGSVVDDASDWFFGGREGRDGQPVVITAGGFEVTQNMLIFAGLGILVLFLLLKK